jgi:hypothetical protein
MDGYVKGRHGFDPSLGHSIHSRAKAATEPPQKSSEIENSRSSTLSHVGQQGDKMVSKLGENSILHEGSSLRFVSNP